MAQPQQTPEAWETEPARAGRRVGEGTGTRGGWGTPALTLGGGLAAA